MNFVLAALKVYLQVNVLLAVSYALFLVCRRGTRSFSFLTRTGQALIVISLIAPAAVSALPAKHFPAIHFFRLERTEESGRASGVLAKGRQVLSSVPGTAAEAAVRPVLFALDGDTLVRIAGVGLLLGFLLASLRLSMKISLLRKLLRAGVAIHRVGRVAVVVCDSIAVPFSVISPRRAYVALPPAILGSRRDLVLAAKHEIQHHRSRDTAWAVFAEILLCLFFPNPFFHFWKKQIVELQEFSCDAALLGQKRVSGREYGSCLVRVAEAALGHPQILAGITGMAVGSGNPDDVKSFLRRRIEMFTQHKNNASRNGLGVVLGALALLGTVAAAFASQQTLQSRSRINPGLAAFDPAIQAIADDVLANALRKHRASAGFVFVSDPSTGKLLAVANMDTDPSHQRLSKHWALSYRIEPASIMKGLVAAQALDENLTTREELHACEKGSYRLGNHTFHDWKSFELLSTDLTVMQSSNICGIKIGEELGTSGLYRMLKRFGFGPGGSAADFPEAIPGRYPTPDQISPDDYIPLMTTGYYGNFGFYVNPLEMVQAYGAIANGGKLMKPISVSDPDSAATEIRQVLSPETSSAMKAMLVRAVKEGTGRNAQSALYSTAGKTATAYAPDDPDHDTLGGTQAVASFIGFAPAQNPRVVIYAAIIGPKDGDGKPHGNAQAAPTFRDVAERVLQQMDVAPDLGESK